MSQGLFFEWIFSIPDAEFFYLVADVTFITSVDLPQMYFIFIHYAEIPRFCRGHSATGCRTSILRLPEPKIIFGAADSCRRGSTEEVCFLIN
jgi:hypothetical protein